MVGYTEEENFWVAERWRLGELTARWTSEVPGQTGPPELEQDLKFLKAKGWHVYSAPRNGPEAERIRRKAERSLDRSQA